MRERWSIQPGPEEPSEAHLAALSRLRVDAVAGEVVREVERAGLHCILLKGRSVSAWLYSGPESREYGDVDLLVRDDDLARAESVLSSLRFEPERDVSWIEDWPNPAQPWHRKSDGAVLDLHVTLAGVGVEPRALWELLSRETDLMKVGGKEVRVLSLPARALHLSLHVTQHEGGRHRALRDLELAVEQLDLATWRAAADLAGRLEALPAFGLGLHEVRGGVELAEHLALPEAASARSAVEMARLRRSLEALLSAPSPGAGLRMLARKLVPSPLFMRNWSHLARRGAGGLLLAYIWRPFWLVGRTASAIRGRLHARYSHPRNSNRRR